MLTITRISLLSFFVVLLPLLFSSCNLKDPDPTADIDLTVLQNSVIVEDAVVTLYANEDDWKNEENAIRDSKQTNTEGKVFFFDLEEGTYYIDIVKGDLNNWEERNFVTLDARVFGFLNTKFGDISESKTGYLSLASSGKKWLLNSIKLNDEEKIDTLLDCEKDNLEVFFKNGNYNLDKGDLSCSEDEPQTIKSGTWAFNSDLTAINITIEGETTTWNINQLNSSSLIVEKNLSGLTYLYSYELKSE